ncbi:homeobox-domain-containing protein [Trematosphaeria pertusa]|uniref:Homeobox-domain-containing protein n=1 Tax=Trematosphaeria pertusa TaxID=390896 RepID=A0A6A6I2Q6_9PLEO|nr:homeobox-domain-containing protein [Trematosphaeria pertusa]KAF2244252.1 homeobox-domain-containing protein [Trematosphaeria pertusa]
MVDGNLFIPLSPPSSPRMSAYSTTPADNEWQSSDLKSLDTTSAHSDGDMALLQAEVSAHNFDLKRPLLRTHKSFPYTLDSKHHHSNGADSPSRERISMSNIDEVDSSEMPTVTFGGSAPASPVSRLTPPSPHDAVNGEKNEPQGDEIITEDMDEKSGEDGVKEEEKAPMTAAELRAQKRKMKRFRLTHNQTRFLMSEFARQAHPDAAHRERLAREIPGLSPRQVQVWFQNRRAKLKRLTSDDRERMMRSRALPDDFDMAQALHSPFGSTHGLGTPLASPGSYQPSFPEGNMMRPLSIDTLRRGPVDSHISPTGISPAFGGFTFTPPQSATDTLSPVSNHEGSPFGFPSAPLDTSPRTSNPFSSSVSASPAYAAHHNIPRLSLHADRIARSRAESLSSPLRASMSAYTNGHDNSFNGSNDSGNHMPYGIGYSYSPVPGFQAASASRMRSFSSSVPRRIELSTHYTPSRSATTPQTATFPTYTSSPLITPQSYSMPQMSAPHHITTFPNSYLRNDNGQSDQYSSGSILGEVMENSNHDNDDQNDQISQSY